MQSGYSMEEESISSRGISVGMGAFEAACL